MTLGELFEETYIQGEIAIRSYDSTICIELKDEG